ncbi:MAG: 5'/3'-nucleotidase SurE, partial [Planctomycetes bacterium]|nr:5'/3'-nucleotidase SurE [Planctomycetota bacterium]
MILLVNDDGINAQGLRILYEALRRKTKQSIIAIAPSTQHSGHSHAITLNRGLSVNAIHEDNFFGFTVDGTPCDCVKLGLKVLCQQAPQLVISGINAGPNVGRSLFYSGTVGAALEAAIEGFPAIA